MDYVIPTLLIGVGVLGVKEHLAIKRQQMKQQAIITKLVDNNNKLVEQQARQREADIKLVEGLKQLSLLH